MISLRLLALTWATKNTPLLELNILRFLTVAPNARFLAMNSYTVLSLRQRTVNRFLIAPNPFGSKGARHGNGEEVTTDSRTRHHKVSNPGNSNEGVDSVIDSIRDCPSVVPLVTSAKNGVKANGGDASLKRPANTFEYLAISEVSAPPDEVVELASTSSVIPDTSDYSDTSPNCDTFKQVKRIDELDYSPLPLPLSKSKLRRLKKQNRDPKQVDGRSITFLMIKIAAWNIRGLNDPLKKKELSTFVRVHSLSVICILETRVRNSNKDKIFTSILSGRGLLHNYEHALLGRIWVCWNPSVVSIVALH